MAQEDGFIDIRKQTQLPDEEVASITDNPEGLTREGAEYSQKLWALSSNRYMKHKWVLMLEKCKKFQESGKLEDGKTVLARRPNKHTGKMEVTWSEDLSKEVKVDYPK